MLALEKAFCRVYQKVFFVFQCFLDWSEPQLLTGPGAVKKLPALIKEKGLSKVLVVTDKGLTGLGLPNGLFEELTNAGIGYVVYDGVQPNPSIDNIEEARQMYVDNGCQGIIAFGGGSPMDCAKLAGARVVKPNQPVVKMRGVMKIMKKLPPFFAVPTTAGTGSETTLAAVVSNPKTHEKNACNDPVLRPKYAVLDPELTIGLPPHITSTTGMDALTHAVEAYIGKSNVSATRNYAEKATALIFSNLEAAYNDGKNIDARNNMLLASYYAGMAFTRAYVGYVHAVAHNLGGQYGIPHGLANAVILPVVLEKFGSAIYPQLASLADIVGINGQTQEEKAKMFIAEIYAMNERMNIPKGFAQIKEEDIPIIVERAIKEGNPLYPVPVIWDKDDMTALVKSLMIAE
ncbi:MAG: iron-containing alcohol dehydrogenase [Oscillospiraceae bacterium]|nr:iron-containing alcohol dehydrogenase [Oscillospiraceae bacterium]